MSNSNIGIVSILSAVAILAVSVIWLTTTSAKPEVKVEPETVWNLVKVKSGDSELYAIRYCTKECHFLGYRYTMDELEYAQDTYNYFAHPPGDPTVTEVVQ
jgi:hypothetical protein